MQKISEIYARRPNGHGLASSFKGEIDSIGMIVDLGFCD